MADTRMQGIYRFSPDQALRLIVGTTEHEVVDVSTADKAPTIQNGKVVYCDSDGIVKIDYVNDDGTAGSEVIYLVAGVFYQIRNVTRVYRFYRGTTAATAQVYNSDGNLVAGIKVRR